MSSPERILAGETRDRRNVSRSGTYIKKEGNAPSVPKFPRKRRSSTGRLRRGRAGWNKLFVTRVHYQHRKHSSQNRNERILHEDASPISACRWLIGARLRPHVLHEPVALFRNGLNVGRVAHPF